MKPDPKIHSYTSPFALGHRALARYDERPGLLEVDVQIEEKVDGSQFSFCLLDGEIRFRSRGVQIHKEDPGMFRNGVEAISEIAELLNTGWTYRGEYLSKPKHNTLPYDRVPNRHVIIFDIEPTPGNFIDLELRSAEAARLGLECVPVYHTGQMPDLDFLKELLGRKSVLGGPIEGVVVKPRKYHLFGQDKKVLMGKYVSNSFKEKHVKEWGERNPSAGDIVQKIIDELRTPQRWNKAAQHLREAGELEGSPRDIGKLLKEISSDVHKDEAEEIKERLFKHFWKHISRGITKGAPEWYKEKLATEAMEEK